MQSGLSLKMVEIWRSKCEKLNKETLQPHWRGLQSLRDSWRWVWAQVLDRYLLRALPSLPGIYDHPIFSYRSYCSSLCVCRSHHITPVEWEKEIRGILEPVEQTAAALLNLSANMLYLETGTTTSYSEVRAAPSCWGDICRIPLVGPPDSHGRKDKSQGRKKPWTKVDVPLIYFMVLIYWIYVDLCDP